MLLAHKVQLKSSQNWFMSCRPDGIVRCTTNGALKRILECKIYTTNTYEMPTQDKYQIQAMMLILGLTSCVLVTAKLGDIEKTFHVEDVQRDDTFIRGLEKDIKDKMSKYIVPTIVYRTYAKLEENECKQLVEFFIRC